MQIYGPAHLHGAQQVGAPHTARVAPPAGQTQAAPIRDEVNISPAAQLAEQLRQVPEMRQDRVAALRAQIAAGTYETPQKLDVAVARLLDEIG